MIDDKLRGACGSSERKEQGRKWI